MRGGQVQIARCIDSSATAILAIGTAIGWTLTRGKRRSRPLDMEVQFSISSWSECLHRRAQNYASCAVCDGTQDYLRITGPFPLVGWQFSLIRWQFAFVRRAAV